MEKLKKIFIKLFILLLLLTNTGLPIALHYCEMTGTISLGGCGICGVDSEIVEEETSCCSSDVPAYSQTIGKFQHQGCCEEIFIAEPIKTNFLTIKNFENPKTDNTFSLINFNAYQDFHFDNSNHKIFNDSSPPINSSSSVYLKNQSLLI